MNISLLRRITAISSLSSFVNNSEVIRKCHRCFDLLSGRSSFIRIWVPGHSNIPENCRADELVRAGALFPESISNDLGMPLASVKLVIAL